MGMERWMLARRIGRRYDGVPRGPVVRRGLESTGHAGIPPCASGSLWMGLGLRITGLRLPQAAFRDLVPGRRVHRFNGSCQWDDGGLRQSHVNGHFYFYLLFSVFEI